MYMASLTGVEIASRLPVISADAIAPLSPGTTARMRLSIASRMPSMNGGIAQPERRARAGGATVLIAPSTKPDAPMPLEIHVAREVVAARPQRRERRRSAAP